MLLTILATLAAMTVLTLVGWLIVLSLIKLIDLGIALLERVIDRDEAKHDA
jgi:hypothetical protein